MKTFHWSAAAYVIVLALFLTTTTPTLTTNNPAPYGTTSSTTAYTLNQRIRAAILFPMRMMKNNATGIFEAVPYNATLYNGTKIMVDPSLYSLPYMGAYMTSNGCAPPQTYCNGTEAKAAISFPNTNPSSIPTGNFLEGTINLQGQDWYWHGMDYSIRAAHVLYPDGTHGLVADMWQVCEGFPFGQTPPSCGISSYATELKMSVGPLYGLPADQVIFVRIRSISGELVWLYSYDGNSWVTYDNYIPPATFNGGLYLGTESILAGPYHTAFYYQFGVFAQNIFPGPFRVNFQNPSYYSNGVWSTIPTAQSIYAPHTYFDQVWTYSSTQWLLEANHPNPNPSVFFYQLCSCSLPENARLWG